MLRAKRDILYGMGSGKGKQAQLCFLTELAKGTRETVNV